MPRRTQVTLPNGETVEGSELDFETIREEWNEYACEDGTTLKLKSVVSKIIRLDRNNPDGEPVFVARSNNVISVSVPGTPRKS